ncbi:MAG: DeoR/GlpR family DNA-binding transcription regulator, partial [Atopostipes suicloacalis]|nr:DeoR/GlpR family DNA-binding transcription regulator [Atopostipes suicloacalis]
EKEMDCSTSTVRRDLSELEERSLLVRVHGGAKRVYTLEAEMEMKDKSTKNIHEKRDIAQYASSFIDEKDIIYLDAGTSTYEMIPFLKEIKDLLVVTNGVMHADFLIDQQVETILIGGRIKRETKAIIGSTSLSQLEGYRFNKTFLGINGVDVEFGYTTPDPEEANLKKKAALLANKTYVLADHTKFDKVNFAKVGDLEDFILITNKVDGDERSKKITNDAGIKILEVEK